MAKQQHSDLMAGNSVIKRPRFPMCRDALLGVGMSRTKAVSSYLTFTAPADKCNSVQP